MFGSNNKNHVSNVFLLNVLGLANPAPIIETFYMEESLAPHVRLDGVLTLVDAKHAPQHLDEKKPEGVVNEAVQQIAYADRILLNKVNIKLRKATYGSLHDLNSESFYEVVRLPAPCLLGPLLRIF